MKFIFVMERPYKVLVMAMAIATYGHILWDNTVDTAKNMGAWAQFKMLKIGLVVAIAANYDPIIPAVFVLAKIRLLN
jgi:uncharacterized protein YaaW (UPF0174 family)